MRRPFHALTRNPRRTAVGASLLFLLTLVAFAAFSVARAAGDEEPERTAAGTLMLAPRGGGAPLPAVRLGTHYEVHVSGRIARTRVVQAFRNTSSQWVAATYLYPLPDDAAVDSLKMVVGQRVIVGEIRRRAEAAALYERARAQGQKAALVEEQRPNTFVNRIANIGPGETVLIEIEYQAPLAVRGGDYSLRLPLVVGPRYVPPHTLTSPAAEADARSVLAPIVDPRSGPPLNPVSIEVHLQPGFPIANLESPYHRIREERDAAGGRIVRLANGDVPADRDFVLRWRSAAADASLGLFRERLGDKDYLMAMLTPPVEDRRRAASPRELIFVIDNSGSMAGASMEQAKTSLLHALLTLTPADRFNIIRFDDTMTQLFDAPVAASADQVALAQRFTNALDAAGGTEMLPALRAALVDPTPADARVRQLIFMTDGEVSNENEMLDAIGRSRGRSRVFMIGIGSAPNDHLMGRMAEVGRGSYTHIGDSGEVNARMAELLDRLTRPVVTDLEVRIAGSNAELTPQLLPDLYAGEPLVVLARGDAPTGTLEVSGRIGGRPWRQSVPLVQAVQGPGVAKMWARRRIAEVELAATLHALGEAEAADAIARLGLQFSLVSRETSLIAVDRTPSRPPSARLTEEELPLNLPAGWDFDHLFGGNATSGDAGARPSDQAEPIDLPQGGTDAAMLMRGGTLLLLLALCGLAALRRRNLACA